MKKQLVSAGIGVMLGVGLMAGCAAPNASNLAAVAAGSMAFAAAGIAQKPAAAHVPQGLLDLRFDNYEAMSVSAYREKAWGHMRKDEMTYYALLDTIEEKLEGVRYTDEDAYFVMNVLLPTTGENWGAWHFDRYAQKDGALIEYGVHYTISDGDKVTMGERNRAVSEMMNGIETVMNTSTSWQLADETEMRASLQSTIQELEIEFNNEAFQIKADFSYQFEDMASRRSLGEQEIPNLSPVVDQIIEGLLPAGYAEMSIASYQEFLSDKINTEESIRNTLENIGNRAIEEREDLFTITATINELTVKHHKQFGDPKDLPFVSYTFWDNSADQQGRITSNTTMEFLIYYKVEDETATTVKKRDEGLRLAIDGLEKVIRSCKRKDGTFDRQETEASISKIGQEGVSNMDFKVELLHFQSEKSKD